MRKVLFYIHSLNRGGAERVLVQVLNYCKNQFEVILLTDEYAKDEYECPNGVKRININDTLPGNGNAGRISSMIYRFKAIKRVCKEEKVDAAIAFMDKSGIRLTLATRNLAIGKGIAIRSDPTEILHTKGQRQLLLKAFRIANKGIFQYEGQMELFPKWVWSKGVCISNPANEAFHLTEEVTERTEEIVTVGRLFDYKNHKMLIDAFSRICDKYPDTYVTILGEGPYREETEDYIREKGLEERIKLPGASINVETRIRNSKMFVLTSDTEGMPNTLLEAMLLGLPCISTDCPSGGPHSMIEDGINGLLVPVNDSDALAESMDRILSNDELANKLGTNAKKIYDSCNETIVSQKWISLVEELTEVR